MIVRFFGVFFLFFQTSSVFGNIISSTVLKGVEEETNSSTIGSFYITLQRNLSSILWTKYTQQVNRGHRGDLGILDLALSFFVSTHL